MHKVLVLICLAKSMLQINISWGLRRCTIEKGTVSFIGGHLDVVPANPAES